jgi:hypothetical protein
MTILEQLQTIEPGLRRFYFMQDHAKAIERAIALGELPAPPAWDPIARWPWIRWRGAPPEGIAASRSPTHVQYLETLPMGERQSFFRKHKTAIRDELAQIREGAQRF